MQECIRLQDAVSISTVQKKLEELQAQVGQLTSAYINTVFQREPMPNRLKPGPVEKQLEDEGFVAEK
jgi:hypothetical protein